MVSIVVGEDFHHIIRTFCSDLRNFPLIRALGYFFCQDSHPIHPKRTNGRRPPSVVDSVVLSVEEPFRINPEEWFLTRDNHQKHEDDGDPKFVFDVLDSVIVGTMERLRKLSIISFRDLNYWKYLLYITAWSAAPIIARTNEYSASPAVYRNSSSCQTVLLSSPTALINARYICQPAVAVSNLLWSQQTCCCHDYIGGKKQLLFCCFIENRSWYNGWLLFRFHTCRIEDEALFALTVGEKGKTASCTAVQHIITPKKLRIVAILAILMRMLFA